MHRDRFDVFERQLAAVEFDVRHNPVLAGEPGRTLQIRLGRRALTGLAPQAVASFAQRPGKLFIGGAIEKRGQGVFDNATFAQPMAKCEMAQTFRNVLFQSMAYRAKSVAGRHGAGRHLRNYGHIEKLTASRKGRLFVVKRSPRNKVRCRLHDSAERTAGHPTARYETRKLTT